MAKTNRRGPSLSSARRRSGGTGPPLIPDSPFGFGRQAREARVCWRNGRILLSPVTSIRIRLPGSAQDFGIAMKIVVRRRQRTDPSGESGLDSLGSWARRCFSKGGSSIGRARRRRGRGQCKRDRQQSGLPGVVPRTSRYRRRSRRAAPGSPHPVPSGIGPSAASRPASTRPGDFVDAIPTSLRQTKNYALQLPSPPQFREAFPLRM
jgi:hypothetical protein